MSHTVCLFGNSIYYPEGGGHLWVYLNWALGLRKAGCRVIWLEGVNNKTTPAEANRRAKELTRRLEPYGLGDCLAMCPWEGGDELPAEATAGYMNMEQAAGADLLVNLGYGISPDIVRRFRRSALIDIDPGLLQVWIAQGNLHPARHDVYFTIGETVGQSGGRIPDVGIDWNYTPPCVALDCWPVTAAAEDAPFTTISHWYGHEWVVHGEESYANDKREGFLPYLEVARLTHQPIELALHFGPWDDVERQMLREKGWRFIDSPSISSTPGDYQAYIQRSRGEFSCCKPSCVRLANAWISDRTICYMASGKPAVVEHTGASRFLPDHEGLIRFRNPEEAAQYLDQAAADYPRHCQAARALVEEYFDAGIVARKVLEKAIG